MKFVLTGLIVVLTQVSIAAHPGHDPVAAIGTLVRVLPERIEVETYDTSVMQKRTISIVTEDATKWRLGKKPVKRGELPVGTPVVVTYEHVELKGGGEGLMAIEVRGREVKKKQ